MNKTAAPKLRFPEFQDEWKEKKLGDIGEFTGGGTPSKDNNDFWNGNIPWVSSSDISEESIYEISISRFITKEAIQESATKIIPANSILLVSRVGVGKLAVTTKPICTSQDFTNFTPNEDNLVFLAYYLKTRKKDFLSLNQGMAIRGFTKSDVESLKVILPSHEAEQQKIADCLTSLDELITAQSQKVEALQAYKKGLMQNLFPAEGESVPRLRFPEFESAGEWEGKTLGLVCDMQAGQFVSASDIYEQYQDGLYPCYGGNGLRGYTKSFTHSGEYPLIGRQGALCGNITFGAGQFHATEHAVVATPKNNIDTKWLFYNLVFLNLNQYAVGQAQPGLSVATLEKVNIVVPTNAKEQQRIAELLTAIDEQISAQRETVEALKSHKKGLTQGLFPSMEEGQE